MKIIQRSELANQRKPTDGWQIIEAAGEHPCHITTPEGEQVPAVMVIDDAAVAAMVEAGVPEEGLLVDKDHLSHDMNQSTEALAWVRELAACPREDEAGGYDLAAWLELTASGRPLIAGKVYKHFSTEYLLEHCERVAEGSYRPQRLDGLALTNRPNNPGQRPITNSQKRVGGKYEVRITKDEVRESAPAARGRDNFSAASADAQAELRRDKEAAKSNNNQTRTMNITESDMMTALAKLGLGEEATGEDLLKAIDDLQLTVQNSEQAAAEEIVKNADTEGELDKEEQQLYADEVVKNRERGLRLLNRRLRKTGTHNRGGAVAPAVVRPRAVLSGKQPGEMLVANRAREIQRACPDKNWTACYNEARRELCGR